MADRSAGLADTIVGPQIRLLIFDAAPQSLDEDIIPPSPFTVHADRNAVVREHTGESRARELRALIRVGDLRLAVTSQSILQRLDAECRFHRDRQPPRQHAAAEPIEHYRQIDEASRRIPTTFASHKAGQWRARSAMS